MKNKINNKMKINEIRKLEKDAYIHQVNNKIEEISNNQINLEINFKNIKKLKWYDYLIILLVSLFLVGLSFLIGFYVFKDFKKSEWVITAFALIAGLTSLIIFWLKNNFVSNYYNDKRRRYQTTYSEREGYLRRIFKIAFIICLLLTISSIIIWIILAL